MARTTNDGIMKLPHVDPVEWRMACDYAAEKLPDESYAHDQCMVYLRWAKGLDKVLAAFMPHALGYRGAYPNMGKVILFPVVPLETIFQRVWGTEKVDGITPWLKAFKKYTNQTAPYMRLCPEWKVHPTPSVTSVWYPRPNWVHESQTTMFTLVRCRINITMRDCFQVRPTGPQASHLLADYVNPHAIYPTEELCRAECERLNKTNAR